MRLTSKEGTVWVGIASFAGKSVGSIIRVVRKIF